jgi:hypothetical protein
VKQHLAGATFVKRLIIGCKSQPCWRLLVLLSGLEWLAQALVWYAAFGTHWLWSRWAGDGRPWGLPQLSPLCSAPGSAGPGFRGSHGACLPLLGKAGRLVVSRYVYLFFFSSIFVLSVLAVYMFYLACISIMRCHVR